MATFPAITVILSFMLMSSSIFGLPNGFQKRARVPNCQKYIGWDRSCPSLYKPVCGSDGNTYENECLFCQQRRYLDENLKVKHYNPC